MHIIYIVLIFCLVLFFYLHVYFQLKTSDDLEIYEIDNPSKDKLEEICDLRQPALFQFQNDRIMESCKRSVILDTYGAVDIKIRNVKQSIADNENNLYVPLAFGPSTQLPQLGVRPGASEPNRFYMYGVVGRLAMLAASYELEATDPLADEGD